MTTVDLRQHPAGAHVDYFTKANEERLANVTNEQLLSVGKFLKRVAPDLLARMREEGRGVSARAVALYVYETDPDHFSDLLLDNE